MKEKKTSTFSSLGLLNGALTIAICRDSYTVTHCQSFREAKSRNRCIFKVMECLKTAGKAE